MRDLPPFTNSISILLALASMEFSMSSFTTEAGRSTTSPAAICLAKSSGSFIISTLISLSRVEGLSVGFRLQLFANQHLQA